MSSGIVEGEVKLLQKWQKELENELADIKKNGSSLELKAKDLRLKVDVVELSYKSASDAVKLQLGSELEKLIKERDIAERQFNIFKQNQAVRADAIEQILYDLKKFIKRYSE